MYPLASRKFMTILAAGGGWQDVSVPDAAFDWLPSILTVQKSGSSYRVSPDFNIQTHAGITVSKTYYVKTDGNDSSSGADEANALLKVKTAANKVDVDRVYVKAGMYGWGNGWENASPARSMEIIGYGGDVILSMHAPGLSWSVVDSHYEASYTTNIGLVVDDTNQDADGIAIPLNYQASVAGVDAIANSWYYDAVADVIYVHTHDSRSPDGDIYCLVSSNQLRMNDAVTYYFENIIFWAGGTTNALMSLASASSKLYFKNCKFIYTDNSNASYDSVLISGLGEVIFEDCYVAYSSNDGLKFQANTGQVANVVVINSTSKNNGLSGNTVSNSASRHGPGDTVHINCSYSNSQGPNLSDITAGTYTWVLGGTYDNPQAGTEANVQAGTGVTIWVDGLVSKNATVDLYSDGTIYYRDITPATPTMGGGGTVEEY